MLDYKNLDIGSIQISIGDLKRAIGEKEKINLECFKLVIYNSASKRKYENDEEIVPKNISVYYQRIPKLEINTPKLPETKNENASGKVTKSPKVICQDEHIQSEKFYQMSEQERLTHVQKAATKKYPMYNCVSLYY